MAGKWLASGWQVVPEVRGAAQILRALEISDGNLDAENVAEDFEQVAINESENTIDEETAAIVPEAQKLPKEDPNVEDSTQGQQPRSSRSMRLVMDE